MVACLVYFLDGVNLSRNAPNFSQRFTIPHRGGGHGQEEQRAQPTEEWKGGGLASAARSRIWLVAAKLVDTRGGGVTMGKRADTKSRASSKGAALLLCEETVAEYLLFFFTPSSSSSPASSFRDLCCCSCLLDFLWRKVLLLLSFRGGKFPALSRTTSGPNHTPITSTWCGVQLAATLATRRAEFMAIFTDFFRRALWNTFFSPPIQTRRRRWKLWRRSGRRAERPVCGNVSLTDEIAMIFLNFLSAKFRWDVLLKFYDNFTAFIKNFKSNLCQECQES